MSNEYTRNHYIPEWYQNCFISKPHPENKFFYLDLQPDSFVDPTGHTRKHRALRRFGPSSCFKKENLYTTRFGNLESTEIEKKFFGKIDNNGKDAIIFFQNFSHPNANRQAFHDMILYLSVQKLRTPKGIEHLGYLLNARSPICKIYN